MTDSTTPAEGMVYACPECKTTGDCPHRAFLNRAAESACATPSPAAPPSDATLRMAKIMGAEFVPNGPAAAPPADEGKALLYSHELAAARAPSAHEQETENVASQ